MTQRISLRVLGTAMLACSIALAIALGVLDGAPRLSTVLIFVAVMLFSEHRAVQVTERVAAGTGLMIGMAAVVALHPDGTLLGPVIVGMASGVEWVTIRRREWHLVALNLSTGGLTILAAAAGYGAVTTVVGDHLPGALIAALAATTCYALAYTLVFATGSYLTGQSSFSAVLIQVTPIVVQQLAFGVLGFFVGRLYLSLGPAVVLLIIVPILIAREMFASYMRVKESHEETVHMLIRALEAKDRYTAGHAERVADYARYMGESLNFMPSRMERLRFAALMHDIGKLVVPNHLLNKPGRLTADEFALVRVHEKVSVEMLSHIDFLEPIAGAGHSDNTRFDPDDSDHPIEPYIVMIADAYDAMTSTRAYRKALTQEVAFQELRDKAGIQFHPACVEALISALEHRGEKHGAGHEHSEEFEDAPDVGVGSAGLGDLLPSDAG